jgi:hypothetical protein
MSRSEHIGRWEYRCVLCKQYCFELHGRSGKKIKWAMCIPCARAAVRRMGEEVSQIVGSLGKVSDEKEEND